MTPIEVGAPRAIGAVSAGIARKAPGQTGNPIPAATPSAVATSDALDPGEAPVDVERVTEIRKAIESGDYPLVPALIADAMIAAGMFLRTGKA